MIDIEQQLTITCGIERTMLLHGTTSTPSSAA